MDFKNILTKLDKIESSPVGKSIINEASPATTVAALKGEQIWEVWIKNNYYNGKYADYSPRMYPVIASSADEAKEVVLKHADYILKELLSKKANGKNLLPPKSALPITEKEIGRIDDGTVKGKRTSAGPTTIISMEGPKSVVLKNGNVVDIKGSDMAQESSANDGIAYAHANAIKNLMNKGKSLNVAMQTVLGTTKRNGAHFKDVAGHLASLGIKIAGASVKEGAHKDIDTDKKEKEYAAAEKKKADAKKKKDEKVDEAAEGMKCFQVHYKKTGSGKDTSAKIKAKDSKEARARFASKYKGKYHDIHHVKELELGECDERCELPNKDEKVEEAGPFSYGAKKPRKGTVADTILKKQKELDKKYIPPKIKDQQVGNAKVKSEGWGAARQQRQQDEMNAEKTEYLAKIKAEKPDAVKNYTAWTTSGKRGSAAYKNAIAGMIHPSLKNKSTNESGKKTTMKKNEACKTPAKKKTVKESIEPKLSFRDMIKLVQESGGQQQIEPVDEALFNWAQRVANSKYSESTKQEVYAGLVYERMGGVFNMYDVLSESKKAKK